MATLSTTCRPGNGPRAHRCTDWHAELVESYRAWRDAELAAAEAITGAYPGDELEYWRNRPRPTFRRYLQMRGR